jgi:hypothetical protein
VGLLALAFALPSQSQNSKKKTEPEQSSFGGEEAADVPFIKGRVPVPPAVLEILRHDETVKGCLRDNEPTPENPFSSWFVAATIHLGGPSERDLIVLPNPGWQPGYGCWYSASGIQWFWIFRRAEEQYKLVLAVHGNDIEILRTQHSGHRDIRSATILSAGRFGTTILYRFDGNQYQEYQRNKTQQK